MPNTPEEQASAQEAEYGTYVATEAIFYDGARAFNPGDPVPVSHVKEHGYEKQVKKVAAASTPEKKD